MSKNPPLLWGTKKKDVEARKELVKKFLTDHTCTMAEAERLMAVAIFRKYIRYMLDVKKIPADRLRMAIDESLVEDVQDS
jgi:hypothetical protein